MLRIMAKYGARLVLLLLPLAAEGAMPVTAVAAPALIVKVGRVLAVKTGQILHDQAMLIEGDRIKEVSAAKHCGESRPSGRA